MTVQKRSFLDAGTEVKPGQRKFTDYAFPPGYSPTSSIDFTSGNVRGPLIGPWDTEPPQFLALVTGPPAHGSRPVRAGQALGREPQAASVSISAMIAAPISDVLTILAPSDLMSAVRSPLASVAAIA